MDPTISRYVAVVIFPQSSRWRRGGTGSVGKRAGGSGRQWNGASCIVCKGWATRFLWNQSPHQPRGDRYFQARLGE
jgi:hypothetical protein